MNATTNTSNTSKTNSFTQAQQKKIKSLMGLVHPDKNADKVELATALSSALDVAVQNSDWATIERMLEAAKEGSLWMQQKEDKPVEPKVQPETVTTTEGKKRGPKAPVWSDETNTLLSNKAMESGYTRRQMEGWCRMETELSSREVKMYLDSIFPEAKKGAKEAYSARLLNRFAEGPITKEELDATLAGISQNAVNYTSHWWAVASMANKIHANMANKAN
jgi:hypothetical protein